MTKHRAEVTRQAQPARETKAAAAPTRSATSAQTARSRAVESLGDLQTAAKRSPRVQALGDLQDALNESPRAVRSRGPSPAIQSASARFAVDADVAPALTSVRAKPAAPASGPIQRSPMSEQELGTRAGEIEALAKSAPESGANLWELVLPEVGSTLYLLGTMHGRILAEMAKAAGIVAFLEQDFDEVRSELPQAAGDAVRAADVRSKLDVLATPTPTGKADRLRLERQKDEASRFVAKLGTLDEIYVNLASKGRGSQGLETQEIRAKIQAGYAETPSAGDPRYDSDRARPVGVGGLVGDPEPDPVAHMVKQGHEKDLMTLHASWLRRGVDIQHVEARNRRWIHDHLASAAGARKSLWIVGASHLAGLVVEFQKGGWAATPKIP